MLIEPDIFVDHRGSFVESWREAPYRQFGIVEPFVQDNVSHSNGRVCSAGCTISGQAAQGKLVSVLHGEVFDVAVDVRRNSPTFGRWIGQRLSAESGRQLWIPPGFAHGFLALSEPAIFAYKATALYAPVEEVTIRWDDPQLSIAWPTRHQLSVRAMQRHHVSPRFPASDFRFTSRDVSSANSRDRGNWAARMGVGESARCGRRRHIGHRETLDFAQSVRVENSLIQLRPHVIVNAAAYTAVDEAERNEETAFKVNADAVAAIGRAARSINASVIHFSTDYVFDGETTTAYAETDAPKPLNVYGRSKLAGEQMLRSAGADHLIIRTSWLYAMRGHNFVRTILRLAHERETLNVVDDQVGTPTWVGWLADAVTAILATQIAKSSGEKSAPLFSDGPNLIHLAGFGETTWYDFANAVLERDPERSTQHVKTLNAVSAAAYGAAARRPTRSVLDSTLASRTFGIERLHWMDQLR